MSYQHCLHLWIWRIFFILFYLLWGILCTIHSNRGILRTGSSSGSLSLPSLSEDSMRIKKILRNLWTIRENNEDNKTEHILTKLPNHITLSRPRCPELKRPNKSELRSMVDQLTTSYPGWGFPWREAWRMMWNPSASRSPSVSLWTPGGWKPHAPCAQPQTLQELWC